MRLFPVIDEISLTDFFRRGGFFPPNATENAAIAEVSAKRKTKVRLALKRIRRPVLSVFRFFYTKKRVSIRKWSCRTTVGFLFPNSQRPWSNVSGQKPFAYRITSSYVHFATFDTGSYCRVTKTICNGSGRHGVNLDEIFNYLFRTTYKFLACFLVSFTLLALFAAHRQFHNRCMEGICPSQTSVRKAWPIRIGHLERANNGSVFPHFGKDSARRH